MASVRRLPSGRWQGRYRDGQGRDRSAGSWPTKRRALNEAAKIEAEQRVTTTAPDAETITWGEWEPRWAAGRRVAASTARHDEGRLRLHVRPRWEREKVAQITRHDVQAWVNHLADADGSGLSASSTAHCYRLLSSSLRAAVAARVILASPCVDIALPKRPPAVERYLSAEEESAILHGLGAQDQLAVVLMLDTGLRLGEVTGLHWDHVDLVHRAVRVRWAWDPTGQRMKPPKSYAARSVPLSARLVDMLTVVLEQRGPGTRPEIAYDRLGGAPPERGLVLPALRTTAGKAPGRPMCPQSLRDRWELAVTLARVDGKKIPHVRIHDLRHTYASRMARGGVEMGALRELMGHQSVTTTERYAHLGGAQWDVARAVLDGGNVARMWHAPEAK